MFEVYFNFRHLRDSTLQALKKVPWSAAGKSRFWSPLLAKMKLGVMAENRKELTFSVGLCELGATTWRRYSDLSPKHSRKSHSVLICGSNCGRGVKSYLSHRNHLTHTKPVAHCSNIYSFQKKFIKLGHSWSQK